MNPFLNFHEEKKLRFLASNTATTILNIIGNAFAFIFFATPLYQIFKKKMFEGDKIKNMPLFLILTIIFNCLFWLLQAFSSSDLSDWIPLLLSNILGLIMNVSLLFFYLYIFLDKNIKKFLGYGFFVVDLMVEVSYIIFRYVVNIDGSFHQIGLVATLINILMYSSPLQNVKKIMKERKSEALPIITLIVGLITTLTFLIRGIISFFIAETDDDKTSGIETMVSNGISFVLLGILAGIYTYFFFNKPPTSEIDKEEIEKGDVSKIVDSRDSTVYDEENSKKKKKKDSKKKKKEEEDDEEEEEEETKKKKKKKKVEKDEDDDD